MTATAPSKRARLKAQPEGLTHGQSHKSHEFSANLLDKIRNMRYAFPLTESISRSPVDGWEDEKPRLFETLAHNPPREPGRSSNFFIFFTRNPLKSSIRKRK